jgi:dTMP kinase
MSGLFILFEGPNASGKSSQINQLASNLSSLGREVVITREPGGDPEAEAIRQKIFTMKKAGELSPLDEMNLFFQSRKIWIDRVVRPALESGHDVIADRCYPSTLVYQGILGGIPRAIIEGKIQEVCGNTLPDMIILLNFIGEEGVEELIRRIQTDTVYTEINPYRELDPNQYIKICEGYATVAELGKQQGEKWLCLDATSTRELLSATIFQEVSKELQLSDRGIPPQGFSKG